LVVCALLVVSEAADEQVEERVGDCRQVQSSVRAVPLVRPVAHPEEGERSELSIDVTEFPRLLPSPDVRLHPRAIAAPLLDDRPPAVAR
jgi:hypothetical protein